MTLTNFMSVIEEATPEKNLKIIIRGLALGHFDEKSGQWKILFPKAPNHDFKMIVRKRNVENEVVEENIFELFNAKEDLFKAGKIEVITDQKSGGGDFNAELLEKTLDFSELHGEPLPLTSDKSRYAGFLLLNQAVLEAKTTSDSSELEIWKVFPFPNPESKSLIEKRLAGTIFDSEFVFEPNSKTEIRVESEMGFSVILTHQENISYQIIFDNDCHVEKTPCEESDFKFYYRIIDEEKLKVKQRFELIPVQGKDDKAPLGSCINGKVGEVIIPDGLF